ncbi:hypothetical protein ACHAXT_000819 [Thalassiosira profunda]
MYLGQDRGRRAHDGQGRAPSVYKSGLISALMGQFSPFLRVDGLYGTYTDERWCEIARLTPPMTPIGHRVRGGPRG